MGPIEAAKDAVEVVTDMAYVRHERLWREKVASHIKVPLIMIESNLVIPITRSFT